MFDKLKEIIADKLGVNEDEITMESTFIDDLGADSLDIVELIMSLEEELEIEKEETHKLKKKSKYQLLKLQFSKQEKL